jgi:hypothetical protein
VVRELCASLHLTGQIGSFEPFAEKAAHPVTAIHIAGERIFDDQLGERRFHVGCAQSQPR